MNHILLPTIKVIAMSYTDRKMKKIMTVLFLLFFFFLEKKMSNAVSYYLSLKNKSQNSK